MMRFYHTKNPSNPTLHLKETIYQAALLIQRRRYAEAYTDLRQAMELQELDLRTSQEDDDECHHDVDEVSHTLRSLRVVALPLTTKVSPDDPMFLFPLVIHETQEDVNDVVYVRIVCAIAAFNMGLACHLHAEQSNLSSQDRKRCLCLVKAFHQQAFHMCTNLALPVLQMALCNNLVEVAIDQDDCEAAKYWGSLFANMTLHRPSRIPSDLWEHFVDASSFYVMHLSANVS